MIPTFPTFKRLSIRDQKEINTFVHQFPSYSDFNFVSLISWDIIQGTEISILNGNLVIKFYDYISNVPFFSILGTHDIAESIDKIRAYALKHDITPDLYLVPDVVIKALRKDRLRKNSFMFSKDKGNFDYIYSVKDLLELKGTPYRIKRKSMRRFEETHGENTRLDIIDPTSPEIKKQIIQIFRGWTKIRNQARSYFRNEFIALKRLLKYAKHLNIDMVGLFIDDELRGFIVCETLPHGFGMMHFGKVNIRSTGCFEYLMYKSAELLHAQGCEYINLQQDLDIENLRSTKLSWRPKSYLEKYTLSVPRL